EFVLVISDSFPDSDRLFVIGDTLRDREGNFYTKDFTAVTISNVTDTTKPKLFKTIPAAGTRDANYQNQEFYFFFDDAFNRQTAEMGISFKDTLGKSVKFNITFPDDASFKIIPAQKLEVQKDYIIEIDLSKFEDAAGNAYDSVYQYKFKTISGLDFTGVSGVVPNSNFSKNPILILEGSEREKKIYKQHLNKNTFNFERVTAGKYSLWCFYDTDSSGTYSYGSSNPFQPSEEFFFYSDTLNLKARWIVMDVNFVLKERE
ncbi:MAG: Ig-like domain-containing protein, partial [Ignavibacteria bacterium]|nr:Ig-like domain-containing protein [Ignavibacteria bacterium]